MDVLDDFFLNSFDREGVIDLEHIEIKPTYRKNQPGDEGVSKSVDYFLVHSYIVHRSDRLRSWVKHT
jgi:hypothetical protein